MPHHEKEFEPRAYADGIAVFCSHDEIVTIDKVIPNPRNPNQHPEKQIELLARIIAAQGWRAPITVSRRSGFIVRGHGRLLAARHNQATVVPVDLQDYATEAEEWADLIADNQIAELSEIDDAALAELMGEIDAAGFPMDLTGFESEEIQGILGEIEADMAVQDDFDLDAELEEIPIPKTRPGDLYILDGAHRVLCGDATKHEDVEYLMDGQRARLCITDPPYNVDYGAKNDYLNKFDKGNRNTTGIQNDLHKKGAFAPFLLSAFARMEEVLEQGAAVYVFHSDSEGLEFRQALVTSGIQLKQCLIWNKNNFVLGRQHYQWKHEPILYGWKSGAAHYFIDERNHTTVIDVNKPMSSDDHPTMKPVPLITKLIQNSSKKDWLVLDLFGGSGTTLIAAEQLERKCNLMELDPKYCDVIIRRYIRHKAAEGDIANIVLIRDGKELPCPFDEGGVE